MGLREYILSDENIYLAIYAVRSYVFDPQLLDREDKEMLNSLMDPFNEKAIFCMVERVKKIVEKIIGKDQQYLFETQVYYKPKDYKKNPVYRPIHTAKLEQLIAMVAVMHPLIYEIASYENDWKLNLSNYSRLIPNNFYGNRVSKRPEELFKKWSEQYKKYTQKANEYFKTFHESKEYKFELKLDLKNFFPSVDPLVVYGIMIENMPVTIKDPEDIRVFKTIIYKLLVCKVTNLETDRAKELYYGKADINIDCTKGIPQGLPQSYFFGNICMIKISEIFDEKYGGKSVYYVDDSYIYTNNEITGEEDFKSQLQDINSNINEMAKKYVETAQQDKVIQKRKTDYSAILTKEIGKPYEICVHTEGKSTYTDIQESKEGEIYLRTLSREASQIGADIISTYSEEEDEAMLRRTEALLKSIKSERESGIEEHEGYKEKLERYYKFFKYREIKLKLKMENELSADVFRVLLNKDVLEKNENMYDVLEKSSVDTKTFFDNYKHDIWQAAISLLITNTIDEHRQIQEYIQKVIQAAYFPDMSECSYISRVYADYLKDEETNYMPDYYAALDRQISRKLVRYANMNTSVVKDSFNGTRILGLKENMLSSFGICSENFVKAAAIVNYNSNRLQRMFLNAIYSKIFKITLSEDVALSSYDKKGITYGELRMLVYLRNPRCDISEFLNWKFDLLSEDNLQNIDYTLFEVLSAYKKYVIIPDYIDNLIMVHKYTCDVWKNGAKHLYFYTLHNQEHAVDLIKNIIKIVKVFSYFKISNYDYYILFLTCYLHDISMVRIASENEFLLDKGDSEKIKTEIEYKWAEHKTTSDVKRTIIETYKAVDDFYEYKIRSKHAKDSAEEIRRRSELKFLDGAVRECVAEIAEAHMMDTKDIYFIKGDAQKRLVSTKFDKILLRIADLLDMGGHRVSKPILNHNIDNMSMISAFHWVSHLLTERYKMTSRYEIGENKEDNLSPGSIREIIELSIYVNLSQFSKIDCLKCRYGYINEESLCNEGFTIEMQNTDELCTSEKCNFLCGWFNDKNNYLIQEMQALEAYLSRVPVTERFYNTKILIKVVVKNPTDISDEQFEILKKKVTGK